MSWCPCVFVIVELFIPSTSAQINQTYGNLEFISPGVLASLSSAHSWCIQHGSTLAEITSEHIWNLTLVFVEEFRLTRRDLILKFWMLTVKNFLSGSGYLENHSQILLHTHWVLAQICTPVCHSIGRGSFPSRGVYRTALGVEMVTFVNKRELQDAVLDVTMKWFSMAFATSYTMTCLSTGLQRTTNVRETMEDWRRSKTWKNMNRNLLDD